MPRQFNIKIKQNGTSYEAFIHDDDSIEVISAELQPFDSLDSYMHETKAVVAYLRKYNHDLCKVERV